MLSALALALLLPRGPALPFEPREVFAARVVGVADGDTITVLRDGKARVRIRVEGIDCPERGQAFGNRAKEFTSRLVFQRDVMIYGKEHDRYGRLVARVLVGEQDLSHELARAGLAWHYKAHSSDATLARDEAAAREARRGLWADRHPVPPWEWRREKATW